MLIGKLKETEDEGCHHVEQKFLSDSLGTIKLDDGIYVAYRIWAVRKGGASRFMLTKF